MRNRFSGIPLEWHKRQNKNTGAGLWRGAASLYQAATLYLWKNVQEQRTNSPFRDDSYACDFSVSHTISDLHRKHSEGADNP